MDQGTIGVLEGVAVVDVARRLPVKESKEADDAVTDQGTVEGVVVVRTAARSLPDTFPDKV